MPGWAISGAVWRTIKIRIGVAGLLAAALLILAVAPDSVGAQSDDRWADVSDSPYYCWVSGLVADDANGREDASFGGEGGYPFAYAHRYAVEVPEGEEWYVHQEGSDERFPDNYGVKRRYGPLFRDLYDEAARQAGRRGLSRCGELVEYHGIDRLFYRTGTGVQLAPDHVDLNGKCPGDIVDWEAFRVQGGDFGDYAGTWSDMFGYWGWDGTLDIWRPVSVPIRPNSGIDQSKGFFIPGVSHDSPGAIADFMWRGYEGGLLDSGVFGDNSLIASWNSGGGSHLAGVYAGNVTDAENLAWSLRSVAIPDDRPVESVRAKWITSSSALGGDEVDQAKLLREQTAAQAELAARNVTRTGGGNEISQQVGQDTVYAISGTLTASGGAGTTTRAQFDSRQVAVTSTAQWTEVVNQEQDVASLAGQGRVDKCVVDSAGNCAVQPTIVDSDLGVQNLAGLEGTAGGLRPERYVDGPDDELHIVIDLRDKYRSDFVNVPHVSYSLPRFGTAPGWGSRVRGGDDNYDPYFHKPFLTAPRSDDNYGRSVAGMTPHAGGAHELVPGTMHGGGRGTIAWPVYFKDLHWYLFELPERSANYEPGDDWNARTQGTAGAPNWPSPFTWRGYDDLWDWVASSAYGSSNSVTGRNGARVDFPQCIPKESDSTKADCKKPDDVVDGNDYDDSIFDGAFFPFYAAGEALDAGGVLQFDWLRQAGVSGPVDGDAAGHGRNTRFDITIRDGDLYSKEGIGDLGVDDAFFDRVGEPFKPGDRSAYRANWANEPIDPNRMHLLVFTFYEVREVGWFEYKKEQGGADEVKMVHPRLQIRRVVCRTLVGDLEALSGGNLIVNAMAKARDAVVGAIEGIGQYVWGLVQVALAAVAAVLDAGRDQPIKLVCAGALGLASATGLPSSDEIDGAVVVGDTIVVSEARSAELDGIRGCEEMQDERVEVVAESGRVEDCNVIGRLAVGGGCHRLPAPDLAVVETRWVLPESGDYPKVGEGKAWPGEIYQYGVDRVTGARLKGQTWSLGTIGGYDGLASVNAPSAFQGSLDRGVAVAGVRWTLPSDTAPAVAQAHASAATGWVVYLKQDPAMLEPSGYRIGVGGTALGWSDDDLWQSYTVPRERTVAGRNQCNLALDPVVTYDFNFLRLGDAWVVRKGEPASLSNFANCVDAPNVVRAHEHFPLIGGDGDIDRLLREVGRRVLLVPGLRYELRVAAYFGNGDDRIIGPMSASLVLDGDTQACHDLKRDAHREPSDRTIPTNDRIWPKNAAGRAAERRKLNEVYNCVSYDASKEISESQLLEPYGRASASTAAAATATADTDWLARSGVLTPFMDSDICADIFTGTPARFTWANSVVRNGWRLVWVISGMALLAMLVWQGLRMTYDTWIEPRPSFGLRELLPRLLLALVLAACSLVICRIVLTLVHDLTCFVAEATGMTLWGFLGRTIRDILLAYSSNQWVAGTTAVLGLAGGDGGGVVQGLTQYVVGMVRQYFLMFLVLTAIVGILILWVIVVIQMMTRIVLIAMLIVFSPLAFAFYASPSTERWTKWWVSVFLGSCFQQAVVLTILFVGGQMMVEVIRFDPDSWHGSQEPGLVQTVLAIIMGYLGIFLALKAPKIVNPQGQGMFDSFAGVARMAIAGAVVAATAGVGAIGAAGAAMRAGGAVGGGGQTGGDGGSGPDGGAAGGDQGGGGDPGSGVSPSTAGGSTGLRGFARSAGSVFGRGAAGGVQGYRIGQEANSRMADVLGGNFLYRGHSKRDDAAYEVDRQRQELNRNFDRLIDAVGGSNQPDEDAQPDGDSDVGGGRRRRPSGG